MRKHTIVLAIVTLSLVFIGLGVSQAQEATWNTAIQASNPANWYKFDETDATLIDHGSEGLNGTYNGVVQDQPGFLPGSKAAQFTGNSWIIMGGAAIDGDWTAEYVVKKLADGSQALHDDGTTSLRLQGWGTTDASFTLYGVADYYFDVVPGQSAQAPIDEWIYLVFRRTAAGTEVFIDGILVGTQTNSVACPRDHIGHGRTETADLLNAVLDEAVIYTRAISDAEIAEHFAALQVTASTPVPSNGQTLVSKDTQLEWSAPGAYETTGYDVYLATDAAALEPNEPTATKLLSKQNVTTVDPSPAGTLTAGTTYYWRVDAYEPNEPGEDFRHIGDVWSFTTAPDVPIILADPQTTVVPAGGTAELTVEGLNQTDYQWYKSEDPNNSSPADDVEVGTNTATLTLTNVQLADEGYYYCVISNALDSVTSQPAQLMIQRLVAQWKFEDNLNDELGQHNGTPWGDPCYVDGGIDGGKALQLDGTNAVIVPYASDLNMKSFSATFWAKVNPASGGYRAAISARHEPPQKGYIAYATAANKWQFWTGAGAGGWQGLGSAGTITNVVPDEWVFVAITFEPTSEADGVYTGIKKLHINGQLAAQTETGSYVPNDLQNLQIGAGENETENHNFFFVGDLDDVRVYNYALDSVQIGKLYHDVTGQAVCVDNVGLQYDYNGNCIVDIEDFALFASTWMNCRIVPDCQ